MRITESSHRDQEQIISELDWMSFLQQQGVSFAHPLISKSGALVEPITHNNETYFTSVFKEAKGRPLIGKADFTLPRMRNWGRLLGELHQATLKYSKASYIASRPHWNTEKNYLIVVNDCGPSDYFYSHFKLLEKWMVGLSKDKRLYGMVHADIHHGNFFVDQNDKIMLFDFDDCHHHWFAYDLAVPLFNLSITLRNKCDTDEMERLYKYFFDGYREYGVLSHEELVIVKYFILYRHFLIYYWGKRNLENNELSENVKEWIYMAINYCYSYINRYDWEAFDHFVNQYNITEKVKAK